MEVTHSNFGEVLTEIEKCVKNCTFLSIDCELTGLKATTNRINAYDSPKQYYEKVKSGCKDFLIIQYGISFFRYDKSTESFKQQSYNFYIFRKPINKFIPDQRFLCQTSSIDFLINQGFDFNKLFKEGIPYVNIVEENQCRDFLQEEHKHRLIIKNSQANGGDLIEIPADAAEFIGDVVTQLENFLKSDETEIKLPKCNAFLRRLIYQTNSEKFSDKISLETRQVERERILVATRLKTREELVEVEKRKYDELLAQLDDFTGFTKVLRLIVESGKLVVGHNVLLDFLHTMDKFLTPLPDDYIEFKECASSLFSKVLDTKYMASLEPFKDLIKSSVLKQLLDTVCESPFVMPKVEIEDNGKGYSINDNKEHEAGYDAYITGLSFISMWKHLGTLENLPEEDIFGDFDLLQPFINKIYLMTLSDNQYINLAGEDLSPSRDHVFHLTFPKEWKNNNIIQLFSPFGNVHISWIDDTSAYVGLYKRDQAAVALSTLSQSDTYSIMTFARRQAQLAGIRTPILSPLIKKRKSCDSLPPITKKRRTDSFDSNVSRSGSKRSIDRIEEEESCDVLSPGQKVKKTFVEEESWG